MFASLLAIAMRGIQLGTYDLNIKNVVELFSGYLQIQEKGYNDNPNLNSSFQVSTNIINALKDTKGVSGFSPRIYADGLISYKDESRGASIFAIEPGAESQVTSFMKNVNKGKFFSSDSSNEIVLGSELLDNLNAKVGDNVIILAQGYDGALENNKFKIVGTVKFGAPGMEAATVIMGIKTAQSLLAMENHVNAIAIKIQNIEQLKKVKFSLAGKIKSSSLSVLSWESINPGLEQLLEFSNVRGIVFLGILFVIVAFGILNTVLMSVTERYREFGVVLSIGMPQIKLAYLIYLETFFITLVGIVLGNISGYILNSYIVHHPIMFGGELKKFYETYHFLPQAQSSVQFSIFINVSISIIFISLLSCIYPAYKVYKLEPLKGIRHT